MATSMRKILDLFDEAYGETKESTSAYMQGYNAIIIAAQYADGKILFRLDSNRLLPSATIDDLTLDIDGITVIDNRYPMNIRPIIETIVSKINSKDIDAANGIKLSVSLENDLLNKLFDSIMLNINSLNEMIKERLAVDELSDKDKTKINNTIDYLYRYQSIAASIKNKIYKNNHIED